MNLTAIIEFLCLLINVNSNYRNCIPKKQIETIGCVGGVISRRWSQEIGEPSSHPSQVSFILFYTNTVEKVMNPPAVSRVEKRNEF